MNPNPALTDAGPLVGGWQLEICNAGFLPGPDVLSTHRAAS
jgi:hypothetical protein